MNKYDFTQTGGFPLDQEVLALLQDNSDLAAKAALLGGNFCILSGCVIVGGVASNGVVVVNGEALPFVGGNVSAKVVIVETVNNLVYEDGSPKGVEKIRYATFGDDGVTNYLWSDFKRNNPANGVLARVEKLEKMMAPLLGYDDPDNPGTTVYGSWLFWGRPAAQIPAGWEPVPDAEWKGRVPVVFDDTQVEFNQVGKIGGTKAVTLTPDQIPELDIDIPTTGYAGIGGSGQKLVGNSQTPNAPDITLTVNEGGGESHTNIQPYKVVYFIRFVG